MSVSSLAQLASSVVPLIDQLYTTPEEREKAKLAVMDRALKAQMAQMEVNAQAAAHPSVFVSGGRPAALWVCVLALFLQFIIFPIATVVVAIYSWSTGEYVDAADLIPSFDWSLLGPVLFGLLGLGGFRTVEKIKGVARN